MIDKNLSLFQAFSMFVGLAFGPYFLVNFGSKMHDIGFFSLTVGFIVVCFMYHRVSLLILDLVDVGNSVQDIAKKLIPRYNVAFFYYAHSLMMITTIVTLAKITLDRFECMTTPMAYTLIGLFFVIAVFSHRLLVNSDVAIQTLKFTFIGIFIITGLLFILYNGMMPLKENIAIGCNFTSIYSGCAFANVAFGGCELLLNVRKNMSKHDFYTLAHWVPTMLVIIFLMVILISGAIFTPAEQAKNLIPIFFQNKLGWMIISYIENILLFLMQIVSMLTCFYLSLILAKQLPLPSVVSNNDIRLNILTIALIIILCTNFSSFIINYAIEPSFYLSCLHYTILHIIHSRKKGIAVDKYAIILSLIFGGLIVSLVV